MLRARIVGRMDPRTEAHPFTAHAQGIKGLREPVSNLTPRGKGMPIRKPRGAIRIDVAMSLAAIGRPSSGRMNGEMKL